MFLHVFGKALTFIGAKEEKPVLQDWAAQCASKRVANDFLRHVRFAILQLRDHGKLSLDDPAVLYLPELRQVKGKDFEVVQPTGPKGGPRAK